MQYINNNRKSYATLFFSNHIIGKYKFLLYFPLKVVVFLKPCGHKFSTIFILLFFFFFLCFGYLSKSFVFLMKFLLNLHLHTYTVWRLALKSRLRGWAYFKEEKNRYKKNLGFFTFRFLILFVLYRGLLRNMEITEVNNFFYGVSWVKIYLSIQR